jgi:hypothetical protein
LASYDVQAIFDQAIFFEESVEMRPRACRSIASWPAPISIAFLLLSVSAIAFAQDVSVTRLPIDTDMSVRLTNLTSHVNFDRSGDSYFIVPVGRYSIQLLRNGNVAYQEVEYIDANSPATRTVNPNRMDVVVGLTDGGPRFYPNVCGALATAAQLTIRTYGLKDDDLDRRLANAQIPSNGANCATNTSIDDMGQTVAGSYGVTSLGLVALSIEFTPIARANRPRNRGNSSIYTNPDTQTISPTGPSNNNLTPSLITDLKNGLPDVAFDNRGKPLLVCAAIDINTPVFCDSNGFAVATPAIADLRGIYRFSVKTSPVDHFGAELDHWTSFAGQDEADAAQDRLTTIVPRLRSNLERRITELQADSATGPVGAGQTGAAATFATPDLIALIAATQAEFELALHDAKLQALRRHFPTALSGVADSAAPLTSVADAQRIFQQLRSNLSILDSVADSLSIDLVFRTAPVETEGAHLIFVACPPCSPIVSQGGQHRFYRGKYYIQATLDGYVAYEGWLDLVEDPRHILECDMVRIRRASNGHTSACSLKSQ